jgi:hypothetical protein
MKPAWFKRFGWFHLPISVAGTVVCLAAVAFCINVFLAIDRHSHSVSDTLYGVFPFFACTFPPGGLDRAEYQSTVVPRRLSAL